MNRKLLILSLVAVFLSLSSQAEATSINTEFSTTSVNPSITTIGNLTINNTENVSLSISSITALGLPFEMNFSLLVTVPSNTTNYSTITVNVPNTLEPKTYNGTIRVSSDQGNFDKAISITVNQVKNWTIDMNTTIVNNITEKFINLSANTGDQVAKQLNISNSGNTKAIINRTYNGSCSFFTTKDQIDSFPALQQNYDVLIKVPRDQPSGLYQCRLNFSTTEKNESALFHILVGDIEAPAIEDTLIATTQATQPVDLSLRITDNVGVKEAKVNITYSTTSLVKTDNGTTEQIVQGSAGTFNLTNKANTDVWQLVFNDTAYTGNYTLLVEAEDAVGNKANRTFIFQVIGLSVIKVTENLVIKPNKAPTAQILILEKNTPVKIKLESLSYQGNLTGIDIVRTGTNNAYTLKQIGETIEINEIGTYELRFNGDKLCNDIREDSTCRFEGTLSIGAIPQHIQVPNIHFIGHIINYTIPEPYQLNIKGSLINFTPVDTGNPETSGTKIEGLLSAVVKPEDVVITDKLTWETLSTDKAEAEAEAKSQRNQKIRLTVLLVLVIASNIAWFYFKDRFSPLSFSLPKNYAEKKKEESL